jgi:hypothetical protein
MSDYSASPSDHQNDFQQAPKRKTTTAGLDGNPTGRSVKRRASKACQCCRARKVRCNVTEHGAPCTNCRLDEVECIVSESRRKKLVHSFSAILGPSRSMRRFDPQMEATLTANVVMRFALSHLKLATCSAFSSQILLALGPAQPHFPPHVDRTW